MSTVRSTDGTTIAYDRTGDGPPIVLVDGAMCFRAAGPMRPLAEALQDHFTVYTYDRRGRGDSTDTSPYAPGREVDDLRAVIAAAGGTAYVYTMSSGAAVGIATAATGSDVAGLALYEPPYLAEVETDDTRIKAYTARLRELLGAGRRGDAVALFMANVGVPEQAVAGMRGSPSWPVFESIAPTLAYDDELLGGGRVPRDVAAAITVPTLVLTGSASPQSLQQAAKVTAETIPGAELRVLDGQTHDVAPDALAPVLTAFFRAG